MKIDKKKLLDSIQKRLDDIISNDDLDVEKLKKDIIPIANDLVIYTVIDNKSSNFIAGATNIAERFVISKAKAESWAFIKIASFTTAIIFAVFYLK